MIIYIVRPGDNLTKICDAYHLEKSDIISNNLHITDFSKLVPGTKLKIPFLSKEVIDTLEETEGFIRDYYPNYDGKFNGMKKNGVTIDKKVEESNIEVNKDEVNKDIAEINNVHNNNVNKEDNNTIDIKTNEKQPHKVFNYFTCYGGNIIPNIPKDFIRKI